MKKKCPKKSAHPSFLCTAGYRNFFSSARCPATSSSVCVCGGGGSELDRFPLNSKPLCVSTPNFAYIGWQQIAAFPESKQAIGWIFSFKKMAV